MSRVRTCQVCGVAARERSGRLIRYGWDRTIVHSEQEIWLCPIHAREKRARDRERDEEREDAKYNR
jgi:hypothetical protein